MDAALANSPIGLGAQNMHWKADGAYTGEISGAMLNDAGCTHVILGHSERRHGMGETDAQVNAKLHSALGVGLIPIVCIGETQQEREAGQTEDVVAGQLTGSLAGISAEQLGRIVLAYEPVWAIGTGLTATPAQAQEFTRSFATGSRSNSTKRPRRGRCPVWGSVKPDNAAELLACPDIDGALVGGASLKEADFLGIIRAAQAVTAKGKA